MGRKPIPTKQRAQPISFSLKPHLIEKIDDYAADLRFSRSKFLQQAVTEYMTRHIVHGGDDLSPNVHTMSIGQRVAVGLAALQEANREGETIPKPIMDALRRELNMMTDEQKPQIDKWEIEWKKERAGVYNCVGSYRENNQWSAWQVIATVRKDGSQWRFDGDNDAQRFKTLKAAQKVAEKDGKEYVQERLNRRAV